MNKPQRRGVQCLSFEFGLIWSDSVGVLSIRINGIANQRVADMRHVNANLVSSSGFEPTFHQRSFAKAFNCSEMRNGMFAFVVGQNRHFFAVYGRSADLGADRASRRGRDAADNRKIAPLDVMRSKQLGEPFVRCVAFGDDQQPGCILIDAVDDARTLHAADAREFSVAMVEQRIHQRAVCVPRSRVDNESHWLVDDNQVIVLKNNIQPNILRLCLVGSGCGNSQFIWLSDVAFAGCIGDQDTIYRQSVIGNKRLDTGAR